MNPCLNPHSHFDFDFDFWPFSAITFSKKKLHSLPKIWCGNCCLTMELRFSLHSTLFRNLSYPFVKHARLSSSPNELTLMPIYFLTYCSSFSSFTFLRELNFNLPMVEMGSQLGVFLFVFILMEKSSTRWPNHLTFFWRIPSVWENVCTNFPAGGDAFWDINPCSESYPSIFFSLLGAFWRGFFTAPLEIF